MSEKISLKEAERKVFHSAFADGLWDVLIGCFLLEFSIAPLLSESLGDFWSSMVFLPFFGLVYLAVWLTRKYVVTPRIGKVTFGTARKRKLARFTLVMLVANILVFILGLVTALLADRGSAGGMTSFFKLVPTMLGLFVLLGFSFAAYLLDYPRLYFYGLLLFVTPILGEWLYQNHGAAHHGWPITFGVASAIIIGTGLVTFVRLLLKNPPIDASAEEV